jgi:hypothetical protein
MDHQRVKTDFKPLLVSFFISTVALLAGFFLIDELNVHRIVSRLLWPLTRLILFISIGLIAGQIIEATGWTNALAVLARPLFRFSNLGNRCSAAFTAAFFSGVSANAMLLDFYKEDKITRSQLFVSNFMNQLPAFFLHLPTTFFIVIPLTGKAGALYFLLTFLAVMLRTVCLAFWGHFELSKKGITSNEKIKSTLKTDANKSSDIWQSIKQKFPRRIKRIAVYVVPIYILIFVLNDIGLFKFARQWLSGYVVTTFVPMEAGCRHFNHQTNRDCSADRQHHRISHSGPAASVATLYRNFFSKDGRSAAPYGTGIPNLQHHTCWNCLLLCRLNLKAGIIYKFISVRGLLSVVRCGNSIWQSPEH